jgi:hypothetical protein
MEDTPHSITLWCSEQEDRIKALQDICLDNPLDQEAKDILIRLTQIQRKVESLYKECVEELFT